MYTNTIAESNLDLLPISTKEGTEDGLFNDWWIPREKNHLIQLITDNALATNTKSAYLSDISQFEDAGSPELSEYLLQLALQGLKYSSIHRKAISISTKYNNLDDSVHSFLKGLKRTFLSNDASKVLPKKATPVLKKDLIRIAKKLLKLKTRKSLRDRTILLVGWSAALRVSELASIKRKDLAKVPEGYILTLTNSKNLRLGETSKRLLPYSSTHSISPAGVLDEYLGTVETDYLFPAFRRGDKELNKPIKKRALQNLLESLTGTSSHGLRRGVITTAFRMGCNPAEVMQISGHRSISSLLEYNDADLFSANGITTVL